MGELGGGGEGRKEGTMKRERKVRGGGGGVGRMERRGREEGKMWGSRAWGDGEGGSGKL